MTPSNEQEYRLKREMLLEKIAFNEKIRCRLVAARYRRELEELDRLWEQRLKKNRNGNSGIMEEMAG